MLPLLLSIVLPAHAGEAEAEAHRLELELSSLAAKRQWTGVERTFRALAATGVAPGADALVAAASAAEATGDLALCRARLLAAKDAAGDLAQLDPWITRIDEQYGHVSLVAERMSLIPETQPFAPVDRAAVERAAGTLSQTGQFEGFLPPGRYLVGGSWLEIEPGTHIDVDLTVKRKRSLKQVLGIQESPP